MKLLTIAVPVTTQEYGITASKRSLPVVKKSRFIVNDGSKDNTARIADHHAAA